MKICQITATFVLLITLLVGCDNAANNTVDNTNNQPAPLLPIENVLREALGKPPEAELTKKDLARVTHLKISRPLGTSGISGLSRLEDCVNLQILDLSGVGISDLWTLSKLKSLQELYLQDNPISAVYDLSGLTKLRRLNLASNRICDIFPLQWLVQLQYLNLAQNKITDIEPLVNSVGLSQGDTVILEDNPLSQVSVEQYIPALEDRGIIVKR